MAAVTVNHNITLSGISDLTKSLEIFVTKIESAATSFSSRGSFDSGSSRASTSKKDEPLWSNAPDYSKQPSGVHFSTLSASNDRLTSTIKNDLTKLFETNAKKSEELTKTFNDNILSNKIKWQTDKELNENLKKLSGDIKTSLGGNSNPSFQTNLMKGILAIGIASAAENIGASLANRGSIAGSAQQSLNTGIMNSSEFIQNYQSQMMLNTQDMKNTVAKAVGTGVGTGVGAAIGAAIGSIVPGIGTAIGAEAGAAIGASVGYLGGSAYSYMGNKGTQQDIANMQFMQNQDQAAWMIRNGLGGNTTNQFGGKALGFNAAGNSYASTMSSLSAQMFANPQLAPYANYANMYQVNENRQQYRSEGANAGQNVKNMINAGMAMGISEQNMPAFINATTTAIQATGKTTNQILNAQLDVFTNFGGDMVKNTGQAVQLMQTSNVAGGDFVKSLNIAGQYQYNQPLQQNLTNVSNTPAMNAFIAGSMARMVGMSTEEAQNLSTLSPEHRALRTAARSAAWKGDIKNNFQGLMIDYVTNAIGGLSGQNPNVTPFELMSKGGVKGQQVESITPSANMTAMGDFIGQALKNLKIDTQNVTTTNLYINGSRAGMTGTNPPVQSGSKANHATSSKLAGTAGNGTNASSASDKALQQKYHLNVIKHLT